MQKRGGRPWTAKEKLTAQDLRRRGLDYATIGKQLGRTELSVEGMFRWEARTEEQRIARNARLREAYAAIHPRRRRRVMPEKIAMYKPCPSAIEDRDRRVSLPHRDLAGALFGDPKPGYSALDRR